MPFRCEVRAPEPAGTGPVTLVSWDGDGLLEKGAPLFTFLRDGIRYCYSVAMPCGLYRRAASVGDIIERNQVIAILVVEGELIPYGRSFICLKNSN